MTVSIISLRLSTTKNGTHGGGVEYTDGVTVFGQPGIEGSYVKFKVRPNAPTLYYYCTNRPWNGWTNKYTNIMIRKNNG